MAEKSPSKDAYPATASKAAGNPALRMMGKSAIGGTRMKSRLITKTYRTTKFQIQATLSQLADLLDYNWLFHFNASV